jgi:hypothetical protein
VITIISLTAIMFIGGVIIFIGKESLVIKGRLFKIAKAKVVWALVEAIIYYFSL